MKPTTEQIQQKALQSAKDNTFEFTGDYPMTYDEIIEAFSQQFRAGAEWMGEAHQRDAWISVQDRLPEPYSEVLAWLEYKECPDVVVYKHGTWYSDIHDEVSVTHWQTLTAPQTPKP